MKKGLLIAIDGPVASGKGTIASLLAEKIHAVNFNTGGLYRALVLQCIRSSVSLDNEEEILRLLKKSKIELRIQGGAKSYVYLNNQKVNKEIMSPEIASGASKIAVLARVNRVITKIMSIHAYDAVANGYSVVMEGRNIGTEVMPDADLKIFLTADLNVRSKRRQEQYAEKNIVKPFDEIVLETKARDEKDTTRKVGALSQNPEEAGYFTIDSSTLSEDETMHVIINELEKRGLYGS